MKTCPYCAEEIKDAAVRCRWCLTWLVDEVPKGADEDRPPEAIAERMEAPSEEPATSEEPTMVQPVGAVVPATAPMAGMGAGASEGEAAAPEAEAAEAAEAAQAAAPGDAKIEFTHTGSRYLLGYGADYFGIWDRNAPQTPIERFPRTDEGWAAAWQRYAATETNWMDLRTGQRSG